VSAGWKAIRWAKTVPPVRRKDGKPDSVAQHVLLVLATFADKDGRARPGLSTLASETYLADDTVDGALERLVTAGLIAGGGSFNGTTVWTLNLSIGSDRSRDEELGERRERARLKRNERQKRYKDRRKVTVSDTVTDDGSEDRYLTVSDTVTGHGGDGVPDREVTVPHGVSNGVGHRQVTVSTSSSQQVTKAVTAIELPTELPKREHTLPAQPQEPLLVLAVDNDREQPAKRRSGRSDYTPEFEEFWAAYGRKGYKPKAAIEWHKALTRTSPDVIMAKVGPYVRSTPNDGWESLISPQAAGDYRPWVNPTSQDAYDEELI
jgi:hypothetical protein